MDEKTSSCHMNCVGTIIEFNSNLWMRITQIDHVSYANWHPSCIVDMDSLIRTTGCCDNLYYSIIKLDIILDQNEIKTLFKSQNAPYIETFNLISHLNFYYKLVYVIYYFIYRIYLIEVTKGPIGSGSISTITKMNHVL